MSKSKENNNRKKFNISNKIIIILIILFIIISSLIIYLLKEKKTIKQYDDSILFVENEQLKYYKKGMEKPLVILNEYDEEKNTSLIGDTSNDYITYVDEDNLYLYNIKEKETNKIATNIIYTRFTKDGKNIIYYDDSNLMVYNIKNDNKNKLLSFDDEDNIDIKQILDNGFIYTYNNDLEEAYYYSNNDGSSKNKISDIPDGLSDTYFLSSDYEKFYYFKEKDEDNSTYMFYEYNLKTNENNRLLDNIVDIYNNSTNDSYILNDFYYVTLSKNKINIINDDITGASKEIYTSIKEKQDNYQLNDIYYYKNGKSKLIEQDITALKNINYNTKTIIYKKLNQDNKINLSSLNSIHDFNRYINKNEIYYYKELGKDAIKLKYYTDEDTTKNNNNLTVHLFYSETCKYCESEITWLDEIIDDYPNVDIIKYDVVNDYENSNLYDEVAEKMGISSFAGGVPFTVIGEDYFLGFGESDKEKIISSIERQLKEEHTDYISQTNNENLIDISSSAITNNGYIYVLNTNNDLYSVKTYSNDNIKLIDNNVSFVGYIKDVYCYINDNEITTIEDGKIGQTYDKSNGFTIVGSDLLLYTDCISDHSCTLSKYNKGKLEKISDDVTLIVGNNLNSAYLFKNYNESKSTVDIYFKNGTNIEKVAFDIKEENIYIKGLY